VTCGTAQLNSPIFVNGQVIDTGVDGKLYRVDTTTPTPYTCIAAQQGGAGVAGGVGGALSTPMVDVTNNMVIVGSNNAFTIGGRGFGAIPITFSAGQAPSSFTLFGTTSTTIAPVVPALDNAFWTTNSGNLVVSGTNTAGTNTYLLRLGYNAGAVGAVVGSAVLNHTGADAVVATSPVTEFLTAAATNPDFFFAGGSSGTYKFMNRISAGFSGTDGTPSPMTSSFAPADGVTSGIVIDTRTAAMTGSTATANIYFGTAGVAAVTQSTIVQLAQAF
jgi:hypothetical protein